VLLRKSATKVSSANLSFVPSTGILSATGSAGTWFTTAAYNLNTISAAVLGNSTFYWYYSSCFK
jgi:hypothetical protein